MPYDSISKKAYFEARRRAKLCFEDGCDATTENGEPRCKYHGGDRRRADPPIHLVRCNRCGAMPFEDKVEEHICPPVTAVEFANERRYVDPREGAIDDDF